MFGHDSYILVGLLCICNVLGQATIVTNHAPTVFYRGNAISNSTIQPWLDFQNRIGGSLDHTNITSLGLFNLTTVSCDVDHGINAHKGCGQACLHIEDAPDDPVIIEICGLWVTMIGGVISTRLTETVLVLRFSGHRLRR